MLDRFKETLSALRRSLSGKAEHAYEERDAAPDDSREESFAAGEAHAFGVASDEVRDAESDNESDDD